MNAAVASLVVLLAGAAEPGPTPPAASRTALPLDIVSDSDCPGAAAVGERLRLLFPEELFGAFTERIHVTRGQGTIRVELARADGTRVVERTLPANDACAQLAEAVAVVVVTWESELHPELLAMPSPPPATTAQPDVSVAPVPLRPPLKPPIATAPRMLPSRIEGLLMAGVLGSLVGTNFSAGGRAVALVAVAGARLALQTDVWAAGRRTVHLGDGDVAWWRAGAAIGPAFRVGRGPWALVGSVQLALGFVRASGTGYAVDRTDSSVLPGAAGGVTAMVGTGVLFGWASARALAWPLAPHVRSVVLDEVLVRPTEQSLGWFEVDAALGLGVRF